MNNLDEPGFAETIMNLNPGVLLGILQVSQRLNRRWGCIIINRS